MAEESVITEEMRNMLGVEVEPRVVEAEKGHIKKFAEAIGDPNPLRQDLEYAAKSRYGGIITPPTFFQELGLANIVHKLVDMECKLKRHLYGGVDTEYYNPIRPGDVLTARSKLADIYEKEGKDGKLIFMVFEATVTNQRGELVTISRHTFIKR